MSGREGKRGGRGRGEGGKEGVVMRCMKHAFNKYMVFQVREGRRTEEGGGERRE